MANAWLVSVNLEMGSGFELQVDEDSATRIIDTYEAFLQLTEVPPYLRIEGRTKLGGRTYTVVEMSHIQALNAAELTDPLVKVAGGLPRA